MAMAMEILELIPAALIRAIRDARSLQDRCSEELETGAATSSVNGLRLARVQRVCMVVGAFGILEAELQGLTGYKRPFADLVRHLEEEGEDDLSERVLLFTKAVNVLKHGLGPSHSFLLAHDNLPSFFQVKVDPSQFFSEGDVSEVDTLVEVNAEFMAAATKVIAEVAEVARPWRFRPPPGIAKGG